MCIDDGCIVESAKYATKQDLCKNRSDFAKKNQCGAPHELLMLLLSPLRSFAILRSRSSTLVPQPQFRDERVGRVQ